MNERVYRTQSHLSFLRPARGNWPFATGPGENCLSQRSALKIILRSAVLIDCLKLIIMVLIKEYHKFKFMYIYAENIYEFLLIYGMHIHLAILDH